MTAEDRDGMHGLLPEGHPDAVFLKGRTAVHDRARNRWLVAVDPLDPVVAFRDVPGAYTTVREVAGCDPRMTADGETVRIEGPFLIGAGVALLAGDDLICLRRSGRASFDPGAWTTPAGRLDHAPLETAYRELYEELLVTDDGEPAFVAPDPGAGAEETLRAVYAETVANAGLDPDPTAWDRLPTTVPDAYEPHLAAVETVAGDHVERASLLATFVEDANTLELRAVARTPDRPGLAFADGEGNRPVRRFSPTALRAASADELVPFLQYLRETVY
ncbi:NUDIX hydrolase [Haloparvum sedimenti]|uniref:NUDIX hydrolase n=1 Tax=Haloparvum sedimenti TaxID=1678448 RepID=UPI00071E6C69|nr:NUDIX domain-containing protein [Haloparvum sedimenti]